MRHLVLAGLGHAHLEVLRRLAADPVPGLRVTLVTPEASTVYSGMLPGTVAGHYPAEAPAIPAAPAAARAGAVLLGEAVVGLDPAARRLRLSGGRETGFDLLSLDVGSEPDLRGAPAVGDRLVPVKPVGRFLPALAAAEARHLAGGGRVAVVGGGAAGTEVALALAWRWRGRGIAVTLVERGPEIVPDLPAPARRALLRACARSGVAVRTGDAGARGFDLVVWATGAAAPGWVAEAGLATDPRGFAAVGPDLASRSHPAVFAVGDVAAMPGQPHPKAGVFAVRQGPVLACNLRRALAGGPLEAYRPQRDWLRLVATGPKHAVAARNGLVVAGGWVWRWKDRIDRGFVARHRDG